MEETKNTGTNENLETVKSFFLNDLWQMLKLFLKEPVNGTFTLFEKDKEKKFFQSLILMGVTVLLYFFLPFILAGSRTGFGEMLEMGLIPLIFMLLVTLITFGLKFISEKPDIKTELFTGALQAFPLIFFFILLVILRIFGDNAIYSMMRGSFMGGGIVISIVMIYFVLMMINIVMQSLKVSKAKDALAWYISPAVIVLSFYLTYKIAYAIF